MAYPPTYYGIMALAPHVATTIPRHPRHMEREQNSRHMARLEGHRYLQEKGSTKPTKLLPYIRIHRHLRHPPPRIRVVLLVRLCVWLKLWTSLLMTLCWLIRIPSGIMRSARWHSSLSKGPLPRLGTL